MYRANRLRHIGKMDPQCSTVQFCFHSGRLTCSARTGFRAVTTPLAEASLLSCISSKKLGFRVRVSCRSAVSVVIGRQTSSADTADAFIGLLLNAMVTYHKLQCCMGNATAASFPHTFTLSRSSAKFCEFNFGRLFSDKMIDLFITCNSGVTFSDRIGLLNSGF